VKELRTELLSCRKQLAFITTSNSDVVSGSRKTSHVVAFANKQLSSVYDSLESSSTVPP